jgi:hypothetical protein
MKKGKHMRTSKHGSILKVLLIVMLLANLLNVGVVFADGETPTEPPVATEIGTEPPVEATPEPAATAVPEEPASPTEAPTQEPVAAEETPVAAILSDVPENTEIVVVDEQGQALALGSQEAADAIAKSDPIWCPAGVTIPTPGAGGCSTSYASITELLTAMRETSGSFNADGTIFLEIPSASFTGFTTPLILDDSPTSLGAAFATLSLNDLTVRGGWNPATNTVTGTQALFGNDGTNQGYILIGSVVNPWVGNIRLEDIEVRDASVASSISVYTSSGNIVFDDVDVAQQTGDQHLAYLHSQSGNITVTNGSNFDGNDAGTGTNESKGFYAETGGSITIDGTDNGQYTFRDNEGAAADTHNGALLIAPTITLIDVKSRANDGNGIEIMGATTVNLQNVTSSLNQTGGAGNGLSGLVVYDAADTIVNVHGGTFAKNGLWGIQLFNGTGLLVIHSDPICPTTGATANGMGCYNVTPVTPTTQPTPTQPTPTQPTPTQPTPTQPTPTEPTPTQPTPTEPTPTAPTPTATTPAPPTSVPTQATATPPPPGTSTGGSSTSGTSNTSSANGVIPLTAGQMMDLDCDSVFLVMGVRVSFINLCDHQTMVNGVDEAGLPGELPEGSSLVLGLDVDVLSDGQSIETLPAGSGIQLDFPVGASGEYAVLLWDEAQSQWVEVSSELAAEQAAQALVDESGDGLYKLTPSANLLLQILSTNQPGLFVLVQR